MVQAEIIIVYARMLHTIVRHHVKHPWRNDCNLFRIYSFVIKQALKIRRNVVITKLMEKKKKDIFLVSIVNKTQYRDTHSEDTAGNVQNTDYLFFVWSC